jgi:hypothetical protein
MVFVPTLSTTFTIAAVWVNYESQCDSFVPDSLGAPVDAPATCTPRAPSRPQCPLDVDSRRRSNVSNAQRAAIPRRLGELVDRPKGDLRIRSEPVGKREKAVFARRHNCDIGGGRLLRQALLIGAAGHIAHERAIKSCGLARGRQSTGDYVPTLLPLPMLAG